MRVKGNLEGVDTRLLKALRTNFRMHYDAVLEEKRDKLKAEVEHPELDLLSREKAFGPLCSSLSIEWLRRFSELALGPLETLFEIAVQYGDRNDLQAIISVRCTEFMSKWPEPTDSKDIEQKRTFWFIRSWYFLNDAPATYWNWLKADKNTVFLRI